MCSPVAHDATQMALAAIVDAQDLDVARAAARAELDRLTASSSSDILTVAEAVEITRRTPSTVRRWCASHRLGRRLGGRWVVLRSRLTAYVEGGAP